MKGNKTFSIDTTIIAELRARKINASSITNSFLKKYLELDKEVQEDEGDQSIDEQINALTSKLGELKKTKEKIEKKAEEEIKKSVVIEFD